MSDIIIRLLSTVMQKVGQRLARSSGFEQMHSTIDDIGSRDHSLSGRGSVNIWKCSRALRGQAQSAAPWLPPSMVSPKFPQISKNVFHGITVIVPSGQEHLELNIASELERLSYCLIIGSIYSTVSLTMQ